MSRFCAVVCVVFVAVLTLVSSGVSSSSAVAPVGADSSDSVETSATLTSTTPSDLSVWLRLRWIFAGVAASSIVLFSIRQLRVFFRPRGNPETGRSVGTPATTPVAPTADRRWAIDAYRAAAGD